MNKIWIYNNSKGEEPAIDYLKILSSNSDKSSRIRFNKGNDYIQALNVYGTNLSSNYIKHLDGPIWELRPGNDRILFGVINLQEFVLLHHFVKKTQKTPKREIEKAYTEFNSFMKERDLNE
ncbi:MAG: type II toxin-antitoxin system RelE/ParE family toxin [Clostridiales bacterium]|nr:type II toxin-antitoxin system RelE/ParE family toxin [Clostridiales bacterium]